MIPRGQTHCVSTPNTTSTAQHPAAARTHLQDGMGKARLLAGQRGYPTCSPELETRRSLGRSRRAQPKSKASFCKTESCLGAGGEGMLLGSKQSSAEDERREKVKTGVKWKEIT